MSEIAALVLVSGEEVVGRIAGETDRGIDLADAMVMFYAQPQSENANGIRIVFRKYSMLTNDYQVFFKKEHVLNIFRDLRPDVLEAYEYTLNLTKQEDTFENLMTEPDMDDDDEFKEELERFLSKFKKDNGSGTLH